MRVLSSAWRDNPGNLVVGGSRNDLLGFQQVLPFH